MRRVFLFAALLSLVGLSTAFAASFSTQSEDVASFTTDVDITVPNPPTSYFLGGNDSILPGTLSATPVADSSVNSKAIDPGVLNVKAQTDTKKYHSWQTLPMPPGGLVLNGPAVLRIFQNGSVDVATAGLFDCPGGPPLAPTTACTQIAGDTSSSGTESAGTEVPIDFGYLNAMIAEGRTLRVQVVNLTAKKWNLQWGYKTNRESRLDLSVATP
jgi:hypothetical protein